MLRLALFSTAASTATPIAADPDSVTSIPGWDQPFRSAQYSGYLSEPTSGAQLHYHLVESEGDPAADPLVLWLNGGPGCSSYMGFWLEQGPFTMHGDGTLTENPYRWNTNANMLFLESPPGVGFSYVQGAPPPYLVNDTVTAAMNLGALAAFFIRFPHFNSSALWLSGESYAGGERSPVSGPESSP